MTSKEWGLIILGAAIVNTFVTILLLLCSRVAEFNPSKVLTGLSSVGNQGIFTTIIGYVVAVYLIKKNNKK